MTRKFDFHLLLHSAALVEEELRQRLALVKLLPRQARVIDALDRMGQASQIELAREFGVTPASMSTMTARLISAGFISRTTNPTEARSNVLRLTPRGEELLGKIHASWREVDLLIESRLGPDKSGALTRLTGELRDQLGGTNPTPHRSQQTAETS
ncbi:MarR family winged helix-turn-helix transcriptional regulator [Falsirhodobacter sp. alg1]|uniref:MarR family winged helix-turn-helix transcriptional regulator n=1 Tax=Falsirhodobacter sp. alg1 TaxID=1472418 RepID=UPI0005ED4C55|nr:MarR family winged helix-turn-helix transcriptional regulator [Falsirhodobacter sp. alg1]